MAWVRGLVAWGVGDFEGLRGILRFGVDGLGLSVAKFRPKCFGFRAT